MPQHTAPTRRDARPKTSWIQSNRRAVLADKSLWYSDISALSMASVPLYTIIGLHIDLWSMFDVRWKPSGSLLDVEHKHRTIKGTIRVSCARYVTRSIYILSTIWLLCIVRKQERGLFLLIFSQYFNDFPKGVQLSTDSYSWMDWSKPNKSIHTEPKLVIPSFGHYPQYTLRWYTLKC